MSDCLRHRSHFQYETIFLLRYWSLAMTSFLFYLHACLYFLLLLHDYDLFGTKCIICTITMSPFTDRHYKPTCMSIFLVNLLFLLLYAMHLQAPSHLIVSLSLHDILDSSSAMLTILPNNVTVFIINNHTLCNRNIVLHIMIVISLCMFSHLHYLLIFLLFDETEIYHA